MTTVLQCPLGGICQLPQSQYLRIEVPTANNEETQRTKTSLSRLSFYNAGPTGKQKRESR